MKLSINNRFTKDPLICRVATILQREIQKRTNLVVDTKFKDNKEASITLETDSSMPVEEFQLVKENENSVIIKGGGSQGILYGAGRLLRASTWGEKSFCFQTDETISVPAKKFRGIYFAVHMHNYYHNAPLVEIERYIEELALQGINHLSAYLHLFHFKGLTDPELEQFMDRLNFIFDTAVSLGMSAGVLITANDSFLNSPENLRFKGEVPRNWGLEICPSEPEGLDLLTRQFSELFSRVKNADNLVLFPYDSGGCTCEGCSPWGIGGYLKLSEKLAQSFKKIKPAGKVILGTWFFDYNLGNQGEWDGLFKKAESELEWVDMIMADGCHVNGYFPQILLDRSFPKPIIGFMDLSMQTGGPWGSFGANPMPSFMESEWSRIKNLIQGGIPYSEGIFEDINKSIWAALCWDPERNIRDILEEYARYEFGSKNTQTVAEAIILMEKTGRHHHIKIGKNKIHIDDISYTDKVWDLISLEERVLPGWGKRSWRWRLVILRAVIDHELKNSDGAPTPELGSAYNELISLYKLDDRSLWYVRPYEVTSSQGKLVFRQNGKRISELCSFRKKYFEDAEAEFELLNAN